MRSKASWGRGGGGGLGLLHQNVYRVVPGQHCWQAAGRTAQGTERIFHSGCPEKSKYNMLASPSSCSELKSQRGRETHLAHLLSLGGCGILLRSVRKVHCCLSRAFFAQKFG